MHHAIDEGERGKHHRASHGMVAFEAFHPRREVALQALLRPQDPTEDPAERSRRLLHGAWGPERRGRSLRRRWIDRLHLGLGACREDNKYQRAEHR